MSGITICIREGPDVGLRKITKIVPYTDGGFAIMLPHHAAKQGCLIKHRVRYGLGDHAISRDEMDTYTSEDRVKLSIHPDGFVQFSGENPRKIISGRDPNTGQPKGLGLFSRPLDQPILSGPTFGVGVWGLADFDLLINLGQRGTMVFDESDLYYRNCTSSTWNAYLIEGFVLSTELLWTARVQNGKEVVKVFHPFYQGKGALFDLRVIVLPSQPVFLGMLASRTCLEHKAPSGFTFGGPSDGTYMLNAIYPLPKSVTTIDGSLDYHPSPAKAK